MRLLQSPRVRLLLLVLLSLAVLLALQISWDTRYRTAAGVPGSFAPFGDELRRADGSVDYRATLSREMGEPIPSAENAVAVYLPLLCQKELADPRLRQAVLASVGVSPSEFAGGQEFGEDWERLRVEQRDWQPFEAPWPGGDELAYPEVAAWLDRWRPQIDQLRGATERKWYCPPVNPEPELPLHTDPTPVLMSVRNLMWILRGDAFREAARGNLDAAVADLVAVDRLGRQLRGSLVYQNLVAANLGSEAWKAVAQIIKNYQLNAPQLEQLSEALADEEFPELTEMRSSRWERYTALDLLQTVDRGRSALLPRGSQSLDNQALLWNSFSSLVDRGRALERINLRFDALGNLDRAKLLQGSALQAQLKQWNASLRGKWLPEGSEWLGIFALPTVRGLKLGEMLFETFGPINATHNTQVRVIQEQRLLKLTLAVERYRCRHGDYPESLGQLVPEFLPELPLDLFAESGTFGYELIPGGFRVFAAPNRPSSLPGWPDLTFEIRVERNPASNTNEK